MKGLTIVETEEFHGVLSKLERIERFLNSLQESQKTWMSIKEVCEYLGKGSTWVDQNKEVIGFSRAGGEIRFKRKDVDAYMESRYYRRK